ncbi:uncharacterized protein SPPG_01388 [Spizellomyces punctatus DAOM BR117]|uniref:Uncharacterized protein n=1 Tax=Spizellomyces punctatus (strain DAOM BR117) TaxID=645134 RepID=A0A0L0HS38_SPIPD|nr:uncharacterized protein SPPG_01388 [Spizellomyces punctatus DAOM BR117]KND03938.1 hypothetical protein SPPG_01388 [Spizellomyces punctatus DAOM BR117]|eukprot:XP_016611977.1 hypothetical protein SPPG_01388 [Spizellomyces punctatus DAOM BR117]
MVHKVLTKSWSLQHADRHAYVVAQDQSFSQQEFPHAEDVNPISATNTIWATIGERLRADNTNMRNISRSSINFLTDGMHESPHTVDGMLALLRNHMEVSDASMMDVLGLRESTVDDIIRAEEDAEKNGQELYYIRSWAMTVEDLYQLIERWQDDEIDPEEVYFWLSPFLLLPADQRSDNMCYIRYVGKCRYPTVPYKRMLADMRQRDSGLLCHFTTILERQFPDTYASGRTFEFPRATLDVFVSDQIRDDRERILIAFFGRESLLNQQPGGFYASYVPDITDHTLFETLKTQFWYRFQRASAACTESIKAGLRDWITEITGITEAYPVETCTSQHAMTDALLSTIRSQATPRTVNGHTIMALIGKDVTREDYLSGSSFLSGSSRAGYLTRDFLARLQASEQNLRSWDATQLTVQPFPFVDLFPWLSLEPVDAALDQLGSYLRVTRPLLCVTFSFKVTSCAMANFYRPYGLTTLADFLTAVGCPRIQHYATRDWLTDEQASAPPSGFSTIIIPHYHPGYDKYGSQPWELRRVLDIAWMITIFIATKALDVASAGHDNRDEMVTRIFATVDPDSATVDPRLVKVYQELDVAKEDLRSYVENERGRISRLPTRHPVFYGELQALRAQQAAKDRVVRGFFAEGDAQSESRMEQVNYLWKVQYPDLMMHIPPGPGSEQQWKQWAASRKQGTSFYMSSLVLASRVRGVPAMRNVLRPFAPEGAGDDDSWMQDPQLLQRAIEAKVAQMVAGQPANHFSSEKQRERRLGRITYHTSLEGTLIKIDGHGRVSLFWQDPDGSRLRIKLRVAQTLATVLPNDKRFIHFVDEGISIKDQNGRLMTISRGKETVIVKKTVFSLLEDGDNLTRLWTHERTLLGHLAPTPAGPSTTLPTAGPSTTLPTAGPSTTLPTKGRDAFRSRTKPEKVAEFNLPLAQNDALWLLYKWLEQDYPTGGTFNAADPGDFPTLANDSLQMRFADFLANHHDHP